MVCIASMTLAITSKASWTCRAWYSYNSHHMWPLPLELWPPDKNLAFCTSLDSWKCLHIDKENRSELPSWLHFQTNSVNRAQPWLRVFLRAGRTNVNVLTACVGTLEKLVPPVGAEPVTASRQSVLPGWKSETLREQRGEICRLRKRDSCSSQGPRGLVDLYRRTVCSAWLKVLAGLALKTQNIVYAA